jgi:indole-3-glycerol phosphate synthase
MAPVLIAEYKQQSPFTGRLSTESMEDAIERFEEYGAAGISIVVDDAWGGSLSDIRRARKLTSLPILAKGLAVDPVGARDLGADIVLTFGGPHVEIPSLVEVSNKAELELALRLGAKAILTNNRDLKTGRIDLAVSGRLGRLIPADVLHVAASGYRTSAMAPATADAVLIGTAMMVGSR